MQTAPSIKPTLSYTLIWEIEISSWQIKAKSWRPFFLPWLSISPFLSLQGLSITCCRWWIASLILKSPVQRKDEEGDALLIGSLGATPKLLPEHHTVFLCANKWGLAAAWPGSFSLMSWRNRQSLQHSSTHPSQARLCLYARPVENPTWLSGGEGRNLCHNIGRLRMIPYRLAGI